MSNRPADPQSTESEEISIPDERAFGPYDVSEAPEGAFLDLGSLKIPMIEGVEVRVQANNEGVVQQVVLASGESVLQLGAFAAPRNEGIWDGVRATIRESLLSDGAEVDEAPGEYGPELRARVQSEHGASDARFLGVDGPRWMVRAIFQGRAAVEPAAAGPLTECLRGLVVVRGSEAMPVEELLPLRLPPEMAEAAQAQLAEQATPSSDAESAGAEPARADASASMPDESERRRSPRPRLAGVDHD